MAVTVLNTTASLSGKTLMKLEDSQTVTGNKTFDRGASAPFTCISGSALVAFLDADKLDGQEGSYYTNASNLALGTVPTARLGSGTADANDVLKGDSTWGVVTTEQTYTSTGSQNDVAPSSGGFVYIRCTGAAPSITGFTGGEAGRVLILECLGTTLQVTHQGAGSTAANRIICPSTSGQIVGVNGKIMLVYDDTTDRWRATVLNPGAPITVAHSAGNFTASGAMTWTVDAGDQTTFSYQQIGKTVRLWISIVTSTTAGVADTNLRVTLPNSWAITKTVTQAVVISDGGNLAGQAILSAAATYVAFYRMDAANWTLAANAVNAAFVGQFEVD